MSIQSIDRLYKLDQMICNMNTGTPIELAVKLRISERAARNQIELLKQMGAPIHYCRKRQTYYYEHSGSFSFKFTKA